ncbi:hypothetical protein K8B33_02760 [Alcanivorax sp. JB21]|uniref:hypothetical protein n=1 Tax=Alcanivorax limicola TaxID=2874102 RepID=UPI001CBD0647|nr:hypothetical protein [Alcanivorax limicola]MBZ2188003.1 hypothetical protein [Alcanivorax limicola]
MRKMTKAMLPVLPLALVLAGCGSDSKVTFEPPQAPAPVALFSPGSGNAARVPFPMDLFFSGTVDGSINIPGKPNSGAATTPPAAALADPQTALNTMDGFGTTASMVVRFSTPVTQASLAAGLHVYEGGTVDPATKTVVAIDRKLRFGVDYFAFPLQTNVFVVPLRPLAPSSTYLITLTDDLASAAGPVGADQEYQLAKLPLPLTADDPDNGPCVSSDPSTCIVNPALAGFGITLTLPQALQLEPLRQQVNAHESAIENFAVAPDQVAVDPENIILSYGVSTQDVGSALMAAKAQVTDAALTVLNPLSQWQANPQLGIVSPGVNGVPDNSNDHAAHIYLATLEDTVQFIDPANPNTTIWEADTASWVPIPACNALTPSTNLLPCNQFTAAPKAASHSIPAIISAPRPDAFEPGGVNVPGYGTIDCSAQASALPVVIYQHGITSNRASLMALADSLARACVVAVGIDLPKHGIVPNDPTFGALFTANVGFGGAPERLVPGEAAGGCQAGEAVATPTGGTVCPSGDGFINLTNLANSRDGLRQGVVDLHALYSAISEGFAAGTILPAGADVDLDNISFAGVSLGGIVGVPFVALEDEIETAVINVSGGGVAKILDGSATFEPQIRAGLQAAAGIAKPSGDYEGFMIIAQTLVDNTDPINYTAQMDGRNILMQSVVGAGDFLACDLTPGASPNGCPDLVVPNNAYGSALGGAWGAVSQLGQIGWLPGQNVLTQPVGLAGTDPLAQGTAFLALSGVPLLGDPLSQAGGQLGPMGVNAFYGLSLPQAPSEGTTGNAIVRFASGDHGSLLRPTPDARVTGVMQQQLATFIASGGALVAGSGNSAPGTPAADHADDVVR